MLPEKYLNLSDKEVFQRILKAKEKLGSDVFILGHNYQRDEVFQFADATGDSLKLAKVAAKQKKAKYIVFCGVKFMAETADILTDDTKIVTLPYSEALCPMAEMVRISDVEKAWNFINKNNDFLPICYVNCRCDLKAFCGEKGGSICTSSNAKKIMKWAFDNHKKVFFLPDENLGINTGHILKLKNCEIFTFDPKEKNGGLAQYDRKKLKLILWKGFCPVHVLFTLEEVKKWRKKDLKIKILVHPECLPEVVNQADFVGSTEFIIKTVNTASPGSKWAIGTEIHLVERLKRNNPDKFVTLLSESSCKMCSVMDRTTAKHLLWNLECLIGGNLEHQVKVKLEIKEKARLALYKMLSI